MSRIRIFRRVLPVFAPWAPGMAAPAQRQNRLKQGFSDRRDGPRSAMNAVEARESGPC
jgi:hypothetical protein